MKWFKRRAPVVVVRDDALANYFKEERQRKENEEFSKSFKSIAEEQINFEDKERERKFKEDAARLEYTMGEFFSMALSDFNEKWWFVINKSRQEDNKDLYVNLLLLWIVTLKIHVGSGVKGVREVWIDLFSDRNVLKARINGDGENYRSFWNGKAYDELVSVFKKHMEDNAREYSEILFYSYGRDSYEKKRDKEYREEKIKEMEGKVKKAADDFIKNLAVLKKAMDYEEQERKKKERSDRFWLIVPAFVTGVVGWMLGTLGQWAPKLFEFIDK